MGNHNNLNRQLVRCAEEVSGGFAICLALRNVMYRVDNYPLPGTRILVTGTHGTFRLCCTEYRVPLTKTKLRIALFI